MKGAVALLLFIAGVVGLFFYTATTKKAKWDYLTSKGVRTEGVVYNRYKGIEYTYLAEGEMYNRGIRSKPRDMIDGEIFTVYYDPEDHDRSVIDLKDPVFDRANYDLICVSDVKRIGSGAKGLLNFEYIYAGKEYDRYHEVEFSKLKGDGPFEAAVKKDNPEIAYVTFEPCFIPDRE